MSLPAGFSITSIDGQRCTAVPRSLTTLPASLATLPAATPSTTSTSTSAFSSLAVSPNIVESAVTSAAVAAPTVISSSPPSTFATSTTIAAAATTPLPPAVVVSSAAATSSFANASPSAVPASKGTTPTTSSSTAIAIAQSEVHASPTGGISANNNGSGFQVPARTSTSDPLSTTTQTVESSAASGISSNPKLTPAPVVGGVLGSMALIAIVGLIFYCFRRRRRGRESLLTPLNTGRRSSFYDADNESVGPSGIGRRWKKQVGYQTDRLRNVGSGFKSGIVGIGASLKTKVGRDRSDSPGVNLNRGNSQFLDGPIPQHSRNNSVLSNAAHTSIKERANDWWDRVTDKISFAWRLRRSPKEPADPFATARSMTEKQANMNNPPDFSQLLGMDDRDLQLQAERRRISLAGNTGSLPQLGSLGLNFNNLGEDPFSDPKSKANPNATANPFADPAPKNNPFADPPTRPEATIPKANTYIADIRRSRGQSIDATTTSNNGTSMYRPPSTNVASRYPSSIAPSRDSYRDTVFSSFSANARKGKGRSDPFDLERPELWRPKDTNSQYLYPNPLATGKPTQAQNNTSTRSQVVSGATYTSKYSSGISSLGDWGEPGPDLGPGSGSSSLRGNASSNGSGDFSNAEKSFYSGVAMNGSLQEIEQSKKWDDKRNKDNVSPVSKASSKGGVGKAM